MKPFLNDESLEASWVVANNAMNRERNARGGNSYQKDLQLDPIEYLEAHLQSQEQVIWLDLCCGRGKALIETALHFAQTEHSERIQIIGVDLVEYFDPLPPGLTNLSFHAMPLRQWTPKQQYDLITCVHGLHYVGDKLDIIARAASWLKEEGLFLAHLDLANLRSETGTRLTKPIHRAFAAFALTYRSRPHLLEIRGPRQIEFPFQYLGSQDDAGPNFTGQHAVNSHYKAL